MRRHFRGFPLLLLALALALAACNGPAPPPDFGLVLTDAILEADNSSVLKDMSTEDLEMLLS